MNKRVAITTLGCKTNQFESAAMVDALAKAGYEAVPFSDSADIYIVNTCTVTAKSDAESRRLIRRAARLNPASQVIVTGCYAQLASSEIAGMPNVSLVMGNSEKRGVVEMLQSLENSAKIQVSDISAERDSKPLHLESFAEHTRAFLQIQNGCDAFCSYCIVPYARGRSRSVPFDEVLEGLRKTAEAGFGEVVLTGIHLGAYGLDLKPASTLLELIRTADGMKLVKRLRVGSVEPNEITDDFIELMATSSSLCPHIHIPLQSGSDTVLTAMERGYDTRFVRSLLQRLVTAIPDISIGFDLIAGFPGETDENHAETVALLESLPFANLHVFPYSSRPGTKAAEMPGHINPQVIKSRAEALRRLGAKKSLDYAGRFVGRELGVLLQKDGKSGIARNYLTVKLAGEPGRAGEEVFVTVSGVNGDGSCVGTIIGL